VKNLVRWWQICEVLQLQPQKRAKRSNLRVYGDSWSFTCSSKTVHYHTELARCWVFGSQDARFHVSMLFSANTISIFYWRTRLSLPSKQGSNWQHQLRLASLYLWHIMMSALHQEYLINCHISFEFAHTFVLSVSKLLNVRCKEQCCPCHWRTTDCISVYDTNFCPPSILLTPNVNCSLLKHLLPYTRCISEWIWFAFMFCLQKYNNGTLFVTGRFHWQRRRI